MIILKTRSFPLKFQFASSIFLILLVSFLCFIFQPVIGYKTVALLLLMTVAFNAMLFKIAPVLIGAILSAFIWNYFFIPPVLTFHIDNTEDTLMFSLYFIIAFVHTVLSFKIRNAEKKVRDKEEQEKTLKLYDTLLNSLSHELRTPISTLIGAADALNDKNIPLSEHHKQELYHEIEVASLRLNRQVENLLCMSRVDSGTLKAKLDWCDVTEIIYHLIKKTSSNQHVIDFTYSDNFPLFKTDSGFIEQIIYNLLHNAITYSKENGNIHIHAHFDNDSFMIEINDEGDGIPESEFENIFKKFYRLQNHKPGGSGLGLSIVKGFVDALNGKIKISKPISQNGTTFTITIPAEASFIKNLKNE